jgi:hypothetical protein
MAEDELNLLDVEQSILSGNITKTAKREKTMYNYPCEYCDGTVRPKCVDQEAFKHRDGFVIMKDVTMVSVTNEATVTTAPIYCDGLKLLPAGKLLPTLKNVYRLDIWNELAPCRGRMCG